MTWAQVIIGLQAPRRRAAHDLHNGRANAWSWSKKLFFGRVSNRVAPADMNLKSQGPQSGCRESAFPTIVGLVALVVTSGQTVAATSISGYVRERGSRESIPYVSVYIEGLRLGGMTNAAGYYVINGVPPGRHVIVAAMVGYNESRQTLVVATEPLVHNIELSTEAIEVAAVEVQAERARAPSLEIIPSRETLRGVDLKIAPAAVEADPIRTLHTLPGVVQLSDFNTGLYVRGGTPDQNLILVDGSELYNVSHMFGLFSTFPADAIKTTELLMGGYPAQYGGRLSSVLNVITDEGNKERFKGSGGVSLLSSRMTLQGPFAKGSFLVSGRRTYLEPVLWAASRSSDAFDGMGYFFYDFQGKVHQILSHSDQFAIAGYMGKDAFKYTNDFMDTRFDWGNKSASLSWNHLFSGELYSHLQANLSRFVSHTTFKIEDFGATDHNELFDTDLRGDLTWFANERHTFETGVHVKRNTMRFGQEYAGQRYEAFNLIAYVPSAYLQDSWRPWPFLTLQPGLRATLFRSRLRDTTGSATYSAFEPRFTVRYQLGEQTFLKAATGRYSQFIFRVPREYEGISMMSDIWFTCDDTPGGYPQRAWHYVLGLETKVRSDVDLSLEAYYKDYAGLVEFNASQTAPQSVEDALLRGDGYAYGLDVNVKKRAGRNTGWLSYSMSWTVRTIDGLNLDENGNPQPFYPKFDARHHLDAVYSFDLSRHWTLNSRMSLSSGQGYTKVLGRYVVEDPLFTQGLYYRGQKNGARLPYYMRLDVGAKGSYRFWGVRWMPFFQIVNVLNRANEFNRYYDSGDATKNPPETGRERAIPQLPFLPTFGVDVEF